MSNRRHQKGISTPQFLLVSIVLIAVVGVALYFVTAGLRTDLKKPPTEDEIEHLLIQQILGINEKLRKTLSSAIPLLTTEKKGNGQKFVLIDGDGTYDELRLTASVDDPVKGYPVTTQIRVYVEDPDGSEGPRPGRLLRDVQDPDTGEWRNQPVVFGENVTFFKIRYYNDPHKDDRRSGGSKARFYDISDPSGFDRQDANESWTGVHPYLEEDRLTIDATDRANPDLGPMPSQLEFQIETVHPDSGRRLRLPKIIYIPVS